MAEILGWWFAAADELPRGDGRKVVLGEELTVEPPIIPCERGLHASVDAFDALQYATGHILYRVRLSGEIIPHDKDKHVASKRTALARRDATNMLRAFARKMALSVIHLWDAPLIVREYLETGDESKMAAARDAVRDAAEVADRDAAEVAARDARDAAWDARDAVIATARAGARGAARAAAGAAAGDGAARNAARTARDAARAAAGDAARAAAWAAAGDAAWAIRDAARVAAWNAAQKLFNEMVSELFEGDE